MIDVGTVPPVLRGGIFIGAVLIEAIVLYVGYGALEQAIGGKVIDWLRTF